MKHEQVVVDYWTMVKTSFTFLLLAFSGYILIKLVQTVFWLPGYLQNNQKRLEELAAKYSVELNDDPEGKELIEKVEAIKKSTESNKDDEPNKDESVTKETANAAPIEAENKKDI